jgi:hypothetical protein
LVVYSLLGLTTLALLAFVSGGGFFRWVSVCKTCGAERSSTEMLWVFPVHQIKQSPLSEYVASELLVGEHQHDWVFGAGGGAGVRCAIGDGRHLFGIIRNDDFQRFLTAVTRYRDKDEARLWLKRGLDPAQSHDVTFCFRPEASDVVDKASFEQWFTTGSWMWNEYTNARLSQVRE